MKEEQREILLLRFASDLEFARIAGILLAVIVRRAVRGAAGKLGSNYARAAGLVAYWFIVTVTVLVAVTQLEIETRLVGRLLLVVVASIGLLLALALGLGLRGLSSHIVSGVSARDIFTEGVRGFKSKGKPPRWRNWARPRPACARTTDRCASSRIVT